MCNEVKFLCNFEKLELKSFLFAIEPIAKFAKYFETFFGYRQRHLIMQKTFRFESAVLNENQLPFRIQLLACIRLKNSGTASRLSRS